MTVYKRKARSLTLEEMTAIRAWLRQCYRRSHEEGDEEAQKDLVRLGSRLNACIKVASATDCEIAEW